MKEVKKEGKKGKKEAKEICLPTQGLISQNPRSCFEVKSLWEMRQLANFNSHGTPRPTPACGVTHVQPRSGLSMMWGWGEPPWGLEAGKEVWIQPLLRLAGLWSAARNYES